MSFPTPIPPNHHTIEKPRVSRPKEGVFNAGGLLITPEERKKKILVQDKKHSPPPLFFLE